MPLKFTSVDEAQLRTLRAKLLATTDPEWPGTVNQVLQMLIDTDLAEHRSNPKPAAPPPKPPAKDEDDEPRRTASTRR